MPTCLAPPAAAPVTTLETWPSPTHCAPEPGSSTAPSGASCCCTGAEAKEFLHGQVTNDIEGLTRGQRLLRRVPDPQGQDARRHAGARRRRRGLWLDCERGVLQELFNMIRRFKLGREVELRQAHARARAAVADRARTRRVAGAEDLGPSTATGSARSAASPCASSRPTSASTSSATPRTRDAVRAALVAAGAEPYPRTTPRSCASSRAARATGSTSTSP